MISKAATDKNNMAHRLHFTSSARIAWGHLLQQFINRGNLRVLLPSYIGYTEREGSGVFDPINESGAAYSFYGLGQQLEVDLSHLEELLSSKALSIVLVIHYFGFCRNDMAALKTLCETYNAVLVEDCAHVCQLHMPEQTLGVTGDFAFYSLHKCLATDTGGALRVNNNDYTISPVPAEKKASYEVLEQLSRTDFYKVNKARISNYEAYLAPLENQQGIKIMYNVCSRMDVPYTFPIRVQNGLREKLYFYLMDKGMPTTALYYRMIEEISKSRFPFSFELAGDILNLPTHQDISKEDIRQLCSEIAAFFNLSNA